MGCKAYLRVKKKVFYTVTTFILYKNAVNCKNDGQAALNYTKKRILKY